MTPPLPPRSPAPLPLRSPALLLAIAVYLTLAGAYFFIVPIFEAPDEWTHTGHVAYIAEGNGLPVMLPGRGIWGGQQPPLYYAIGALLVQPFEIDGIDTYETERRNPHSSLGFALDPGNKNNYLHGPAESFPYRGLTLTVHLLRLYSMTFGLVTLIFTYLTAYEITNYQLPITNYQLPVISSPHLFAGAVAFFVACQPMFAFITASVANEPANMAFSAIALWLTQRYILYGPTPKWRRAVALGLALGLISLSKMTGLAFGLVAVVAFLQVALATRRRSGAARLLWRDGLIIGLLFLVVGGWWYGRNYRLYGDFFQQGLYKLYFNVEPQPLTLSQFLYTLSTGEVSFWATFGWLNIVGPDWLYSVYRIISRVGLVGVAVGVIAQAFRWPGSRGAEGQGGRGVNIPPAPLPPCPPALLLHLLFPVALAFSLTRLVATEGGLQGRQLLPALGSIAIIICWGWWVLTPARFRKPLFILLAAGLLGLAVWLPYGLVRPAYVPPPLLTEAQLPPDLPRLDLTFNGEMKLLAARIEAEVARPGERVPVTVYWQALRPMTTNYSVFVHLIGRDYENVGQFNTYPALGLRPTTTLRPGQIVKDTYPVLVNGGSAAPSRLLVNVGLFDFDEPGRPGIPPLTSSGEPAASTVGQIKLVPATWPPLEADAPVATFGEQIWLMSYQLEGCQSRAADCRLTFHWLAQGSPAADYTVFIQLWPESPLPDGPPFFGFDGPPLHNDYPTGLWAAGEVIRDAHRLDLSQVPPGTYRLQIGLYEPLTGQRLPVQQQGQPLPNQALELDPLHLR